MKLLSGSRVWVCRWLRRGLFAVLLAGAVWQWLLPWCFPLPGSLTNPPLPSAVLTDRHGKPLRRYLSSAEFRSDPVPLYVMPPELIQCLLAAEDARFYSHGGVDYLAVARALRDALTDGRFTSGASTITQQLVKISNPPAARNLWTKLREMQQARHLEMTWSKDRILEEYLNRVDFGNLCQGAAAAAQYYFGKPVSQLSLAECAWIAGLPQSPTRHSRAEPEGTRRQDFVLERWAALHPAGADRAAAAARERLSFSRGAAAGSAPHLLAGLREAARQHSGPLPTSLDLPLQEKCEDILRAEIARLAGRHVSQGAAVVLDNGSGEVLALVGSADWEGPGGQINGALIPRSAGSTLKPFTYGLALEQGWSPAGILEDVPSFYEGPSGAQIEVVNYDHRHRGPVSLREALACSLNIPAVRLLRQAGGPPALHAVLTKAGISTLEPEARHYGLGLTIGNAEVNLVDLTAAYAALARGGLRCVPSLFSADAGLDSAGRVGRLTGDETATPVRIFTETTCWLLADILSDPAARSAQFGSGGPLRLPFRCAVKTGTSSDFRDNWCVGFTPRYTVGIWMGNFDGTPMYGVSGASGAAPAFHRIMAHLHRDGAPVWPERPAEIQIARVDTRTGRSPALNAPSVWVREEYCLTAPAAAPPGELASDGRAVLDESRWGAWYRSAANERTTAFAIAAPVANAPRILSPRDGILCRLDPELPNGGRTLVLRTDLDAADAVWESSTLTVTGDHTLKLTPGEHRLRLTDRRTGASAEACITVAE